MPYECLLRSEDVSTFQKGLHLFDTQWSAQSQLQQRQTPEAVLLEGEWCSMQVMALDRPEVCHFDTGIAERIAYWNGLIGL